MSNWRCLFADLALATSFLGVALGLFDYGRSIPAPQYGVRTPANRADYLSAAAGVCAFYPRGFVMALGYAGVALAVLALLIPAMLVWQCRKQIQILRRDIVWQAARQRWRWCLSAALS